MCVRAHSEPSVSGDLCKPDQFIQQVATGSERTQVFKPSLNLSF